MVRRKLSGVHYLKIASDLKKGKTRTEIAKELHIKYGVTLNTAVNSIGNVFPKTRVTTHSEIDAALEKKRREMLSETEDWLKRQKIARQNNERLTFKQRSTASKKAAQTKGPKRRSQIARDREQAMGPEARRQRALKREKEISPEEKSRIRRAIALSIDPEKRKERSRHAHAIRISKMTAQEISEMMSHVSRVGQARMTAERKDEIAKKRWETRRARQLEGIEYVRELPDQHVVPSQEMEHYLEDLHPLVNEFIERFRRHDWEDIRQEIYVGAMTALVKWDGKRNLEQLTRDCIRYQLIGYFGEERKYEQVTRVLSPEFVAALHSQLKLPQLRKK